VRSLFDGGWSVSFELWNQPGSVNFFLKSQSGVNNAHSSLSDPTCYESESSFEIVFLCFGCVCGASGRGGEWTDDACEVDVRNFGANIRWSFGARARNWFGVI
jgi:hypothetical protein